MPRTGAGRAGTCSSTRSCSRCSRKRAREKGCPAAPTAYADGLRVLLVEEAHRAVGGRVAEQMWRHPDAGGEFEERRICDVIGDQRPARSQAWPSGLVFGPLGRVAVIGVVEE